MDMSLQEKMRATCSECKTTFDARMWVIVDAQARPELVDLLCHDGLHIATCPKGHRVPVAAPLLVYLRDAEHWTCFSMPEMSGGEDPEKTNAQASRLFDIMLHRLGDEVDPRVLAMNHHAMPLVILKRYLAGDPKVRSLANAVAQAARAGIVGRKDR